MKRLTVTCGLAILLSAAVAAPAAGDRPFSTSGVFIGPRTTGVELDSAEAGTTGSKQSKVEIERFRCSSSGDPTGAVDMSCNAEELGQSYSPDNEVAVAVNPLNADHIVAGSNDYFYRFNNSTGARQVLVPTGFFTSFDGGETWLDGQIPMLSGNGAGDPSPAFNAALSGEDPSDAWVMMAQLENTAGQGGPFVSQGDVSVSRSTDGGITWSEPVTVMMGTGAGIGPSNRAVFWDKEWLTVDNNPESEFFGRAYLTASRFVNGLHGSYAESAIYLSWSDDGGVTWTTPKEISGSNPDVCTFQISGPDDECDEDQFSIPVVAGDGRLYVHFSNEQNEAAWDVDLDFDTQIMVVSSTDGGVTISDPVPAAQLEDGGSDMPRSVIGRQTVWGHQIRWAPYGNLVVDPNDPEHVVVIWADRGAPNPNATSECLEDPAEAPNYDPCEAGPGSDLDVFKSESVDGGATWGDRMLVDDGGGAAQWFPWGGYQSDGDLVIAWDEDTAPAPADTFVHVLWDSGDGKQILGVQEHVDESLTHWAGQYTTAWPTICGPAGYTDPPVTDAEGKDCNVFHGDYTGLAIGPDDSIHVTWTGLNRLTTSPQIDFYTGEAHDGYAQDAMYARR